VQKMYFV